MSAEPNSPRAGELSWRLDGIERRMDKAEEAIDKVPLIEERLRSAVDRLDAIYKVLWTIAGGLVLLVVSVLFAAASIGGG